LAQNLAVGGVRGQVQKHMTWQKKEAIREKKEREIEGET